MFKLLLLSYLFLLSSFNVNADDTVGEIDVTKRCETEKQATCHGACLDDWSNSCYFDSSSSTPDPKLALDSQKEKCFAYYENSVCAPCKNNHLLNKDGVFKKVSCEEFYQQINTNNVTCDGCLKYIFNARG